MVVEPMSFWRDDRRDQSSTPPSETAVVERSRGRYTSTGHHGAQLSDEVPLGDRARRGVLSGGLAQGLQQVLSVGATLVLTRILAPEDFGIVAAANSLLALSALVLAMGIGAAVVARPQLTADWTATMFWFAATAGGLVSCMFVFAAPLLARLFGLPDAGPYLAALAPTILLGLTASVPLALLRRRLAFARYWSVHSIAMVVYVTVQVVLAVRGWGAWAVIAGQIALSVTTFLGALIASRYVPVLSFTPRFVREELRFGGAMLGNSALTYGAKNADYWVVGNLLGASTLGAYYLAYVLPDIFVQRVTKIVDTVLVPVFARSAGDAARTRRVYIESVRLQAGIGVPAMVGLAVLAVPVVELCFGDRWSDVAKPMRWIAVAGALTLSATIPAQVSLGHKLVRPIIRSQVARMSALVPALLVAAVVWRTAEAVAIAFLISAVIWFVSQQILVAGPLGLPFRLVAKDLLAIGTATVAMAGVLVIFGQGWEESSAWVQISGGVSIGASVYGGVGMLGFPRTFVPLFRQALLVSAAAAKRSHE